MPTIRAGNITKGSYIIHKNAVHRVMKANFFNPGKGSALMRTKLKSVETDQTVDFSFKTGESVEEAEVTKKELQFLYSDNDGAVFMDERSYEQVSVPKALVEEGLGYLNSEVRVHVLFYEDKPIGMLLPPSVTLQVTEAFEATAGGRVNSPKKTVKLETGMEVLAPLFIKTGDRVVVDTSSGEYLSRATK